MFESNIRAIYSIWLGNMDGFPFTNSKEKEKKEYLDMFYFVEDDV